jgi:acyl-CoA thioester hydrolase
VWARVAAVGRSSVTLESQIRDGDRVMARSRVVEVNVDDDGAASAWHPRHLELFEQRVG